MATSGSTLCAAGIHERRNQQIHETFVQLYSPPGKGSVYTIAASSTGSSLADILMGRFRAREIGQRAFAALAAL
jgi:hypothetical protein